MRTLIIILALGCAGALHAQVATNITITLNLTQRQWTALESSLAIENAARTNDVPPRAELTAQQHLRNLCQREARDLVDDYDLRTRLDLLARFTNATPAQQSAVFTNLPPAPKP